LGEAAGDKEATGDKALATGDKALATGDKALATGDKALATGDKALATDEGKYWRRDADDADADAEDAFLLPGFRFWLHLPVFPQTHSFAAASHSAFCFLTEHLLPPTLDLVGIVLI
jgi:hypothetical protein